MGIEVARSSQGIFNSFLKKVCIRLIIWSGDGWLFAR